MPYHTAQVGFDMGSFAPTIDIFISSVFTAGSFCIPYFRSYFVWLASWAVQLFAHHVLMKVCEVFILNQIWYGKELNSANVMLKTLHH